MKLQIKRMINRLATWVFEMTTVTETRRCSIDLRNFGPCPRYSMLHQDNDIFWVVDSERPELN